MLRCPRRQHFLSLSRRLCPTFLATCASFASAHLAQKHSLSQPNCQAMGLEGGTDGVVSGAELNEAAYQEALASAPQLFSETLRSRGKQLTFAPDRQAALL